MICIILSCLLDITQDHTPQMRQTVQRVIKFMGKERNYGIIFIKNQVSNFDEIIIFIFVF